MKYLIFSLSYNFDQFYRDSLKFSHYSEGQEFLPKVWASQVV